MEQLTFPAMPDAPSVVGRGKCFRIVRTVQDVERVGELLRDVTDAVRQEVIATIPNPNGAVMLWGDRGLASFLISETPFSGRFACITWLQNDRSTHIREALAHIEAWAMENGATKVIANVEREGPWARLTGYYPYRLVLMKELS